MADLSTAVEYERIHNVEIKRLDNDEPTGITIGVVSRDSKRVTDGMREWQAATWEKQRKAGKEGLSDADQIELLESQGRETLVHAIVSWDWGDHSWNHISGKSDSPSIEDRRFLINHPNAKWLIDQIVLEVANIENFTSGLPKNARSGSKKT